MSYFTEVKKLEAAYALKPLDRAKLLALYPVFKLHYWFDHGTALRKAVARFAFESILKGVAVRIALFSTFHRKYVRVPLWLVPDHLTSFREIFWYHGYALDPGWKPTSLIDAGANIGYASLYFAFHHPIRSILAIEANPRLFAKLGEIARVISGLGVDIRVAKGALVGIPRKLLFQIRSNSRDSSVGASGDSFGSGSLGAIEVDGRRLADWKSSLGFKPDEFSGECLLKIDVEGSEYEILEQDPEVFRGPAYLIGEIHGEQARRDGFAAELSSQVSISKRITTPACATVEVLYGYRRVG
ncbi:MAG: FkbM family methyltransferase [Oligoflexia bacterium]|nr:FkbM family methyltransferase [Oligoflexia bacterium]